MTDSLPKVRPPQDQMPTGQPKTWPEGQRKRGWEVCEIRLYLEEKSIKQDMNTATDPFSDYPDVVDVEQLSKMLDISTKTAYKILKMGEIDSIRIGRDYKIAKSNVIKYLKLIP